VDTNYFQCLGLPVAYTIDLPELRQRWQQAVSAVHPDRVAQGTPEAQRLALQRSAHLNAAYQTLKCPVQRAAHVLACHGEGLNNTHETIADLDFLSAQMSLRESLEEAGDTAAVASVQAEAADWLTQLQREFVGDVAREDWVEARDVVRKMQFMSKLWDEAQARFDDWDDEAD